MSTSTTGPPLVSVVIPVRNGARDLPRCLASIAAAGSHISAEVIVVDNGSTDGSAEIARAAGARVLVASGVRVGAVRNAGARQARGGIVAFVDSDNEVAPTWLVSCVEALTDPGAGAAGLLCQAPADGTWVQRLYDLLRRRPEQRVEIEWLGAANLAMRRDVFDEIGGFDESLEACEDVDLCRRIRRTGRRLMAEPGMASVHHGDPPTLWALFVGEMWRGRDNLRVSLRGPLTLRSLPGTLTPLAMLTLLVALPIAAAAAFVVGATPLMATLGALLAVVLLRTIVIVRRGRIRPSFAWVRSLAVAGVFELGRALALLGRASHRTRTSARPA
jgi:GT2 family glycosyltransferase